MSGTWRRWDQEEIFHRRGYSLYADDTLLYYTSAGFLLHLPRKRRFPSDLHKYPVNYPSASGNIFTRGRTDDVEGNVPCSTQRASFGKLF